MYISNRNSFDNFRQAPPNQMPSNHFHQNQSAGPNPWWNHPNRYGHSMPGIHQKDLKTNDTGQLDTILRCYECLNG